MKKWFVWLFTLFLGATLLLAGCALEEGSASEGESVEFTVVGSEEIPPELKSIVESNKETEMMLSYRIEDYFYLVRGYGKQETGGYSITVDGVTLQEDGIHLATTLLGPPSGEEIPKESSCPYVVVKIAYMEKQVLFD